MSDLASTLVRMSPGQIGFSDLPELLGVSRATAARIARRADFPEAEVIAGRRVWKKTKVEAWARKNPPRPPGRPPKQG
jgi:predicted DNA-binding transcriptional regulator AlpA